MVETMPFASGPDKSLWRSPSARLALDAEGVTVAFAKGMIIIFKRWET